MPLHFAGNKIELANQANIALAIAHHLPITLHRVDAANKAILLAIGDVKLCRDVVRVHRHTDFIEQIENQLAAGDRIFVFRPFALDVRIVRAHQGG